MNRVILQMAEAVIVIAGMAAAGALVVLGLLFLAGLFGVTLP